MTSICWVSLPGCSFQWIFLEIHTNYFISNTAIHFIVIKIMYLLRTIQYVYCLCKKYFPTPKYDYHSYLPSSAVHTSAHSVSFSDGLANKTTRFVDALAKKYISRSWHRKQKLLNWEQRKLPSPKAELPQPSLRRTETPLLCLLWWNKHKSL